MDQTRDLSNRDLYRLTQLLDAPEFVKSAETEALCGDAELPTEVFAEPVHRLFPCHTPAATWASTAFFLDKQASFNKHDVTNIQSRLDYYATYHAINHAIKDLRDKFAAVHTKTEPVLTDDDYALVADHKGQKICRYPMRNSTEVKTAAAYLHQHRDTFPYNVRRDWADKVLQKSAAIGVNLGEHAEYINRQAGYGYCLTKAATNALRSRVNASRKGPGPLSELQTELAKLANVLDNKPAKLHEPGMTVKLAEVMDSFDRETGLYRQYGEYFRRPEDVLFDITVEKMAEAYKAHVSTTTGNVYQVSDLEKLASHKDKLASFMGDDFTDAVTSLGKVDVEKLAAIVPTLDRELASMFDSLMSHAGYAPAAKEASAAQGLSREYLQHLGQEYRQTIR